MTDHSDLIERLHTHSFDKILTKSGIVQTCPQCSTPGSLMEEAADALREQQETMEIVSDALQKLPGGFWETWTSCSFRRISKRGGADGSVLHAKIQRSDGHPDLSWSESECEAICVLVNTLRAALQADMGIPISELVKSGKGGE